MLSSVVPSDGTRGNFPFYSDQTSVLQLFYIFCSIPTENVEGIVLKKLF